MDEAVAAANAEDWARAADLFAAIDAEIGDDPFDPQRYGWVHFYCFKAAYMNRDHEAAWALLTRPRRTAAMSSKNAAWMSSVGAELAARLGRPDDVVTQAERCLEIRGRLDEPGAAAMTAKTACALLESIGADHLNRRFATILIAAAEVAVRAYGYRALARSVAANPNPLDIDELIAGRDWLAAHADARHAAEALAMIDGSEAVAARGESAAIAGAMWNAGLAGDLGELERQLDAGVDPNVPWTMGRNALQGAALGGHLAAVERLLAVGADPDLRTSQGRGALHFAADENHAAIAERLIAAGAEVDRIDMFGQTPLHLCGWQGHLEVARVLLAAGADPDTQDANGATPLSLAVTEDVPDIVDVFCDSGVPVDQRQGMGWTPLMCAANAGMLRVVERLLARGADASIADDYGRTARSLAKEEGHKKVARRLR
jgi:ankyrin repeat protein